MHSVCGQGGGDAVRKSEGGPVERDAFVELIQSHPHVWLFDIRTPEFQALADTDFTSASERKRAARSADAGMERAVIARRSALRLLLARYVGRPPQTLKIVTAPGGKPVLVPTPDSVMKTVAFSVCHSGDLYCVAVGSEQSLGLDVERIREVSRARAIAERWFGPGEADRLSGLAGDEVMVEFMRIWTAKEALAKRHGAGLRLMRGDDVELDVDANAGKGRLRHFSPGDGYVGAIAATGPIEGVHIRCPEDDFWTI